MYASCVVVTASLYVNNPFICMPPADITNIPTKYVQNLCWMAGTYYLPFDEEIPSEAERSEQGKDIPYYQWMPFILVGQALLFYMPSVLWHAFNQRAGVDADTIVSTAKGLDKAAGNSESHRDRIKMIFHQMDSFLITRKTVDMGVNFGKKHNAKQMVAKTTLYSSRR